VFFNELELNRSTGGPETPTLEMLKKTRQKIRGLRDTGWGNKDSMPVAFNRPG